VGDAEIVGSMQGKPPRRTRRGQPPGRSSLPLIPILIGVVVLGFVIGAGLSMLGNHGPQDVAVVASPTAAETIPPVRVVPSPLPRTPAPLPATPSPHPSRSPKPLPSPARDAASPAETLPPPLPSPSPRKPPPEPTPAALASDEAASPASSAIPASVASAPKAPASPVAAASPQASATSQPPPANPDIEGATSPFARLAASVVRVYLGSVARGDRESAAAELASPPPGSLVEDGIVDGSTELRRIEVHGTGDVVTVDVDLKTSAGLYAAQYTVKKTSTGAAVISENSIVKS
jgi:hypothetical protein